VKKNGESYPEGKKGIITEKQKKTGNGGRPLRQIEEKKKPGEKRTGGLDKVLRSWEMEKEKKWPESGKWKYLRPK